MSKDKNKDKRKVNIPYLIIAIVASLVIWVVMTSTNEEEYTKVFNGVSVVFEGQESLRDTKDFIITDQDITNVRLSIKGPRSSMLKLDSSDLSAVIDLSSIAVTGTYTLSYSVEYPSGTDASQLTITNRSPSTISFKIDKISSRTVDIVAQFNGSVADGFSAEPVVVSPATITLDGPEDSLNKVAYALVSVDKQDIDKTTTYDSPFELIGYDGETIEDDSISTDIKTVNVTIPVLSVKDVTLDINIVDGGGATSKNVIYSIDPDTVTLSGDADTISGINSITIASVDLSQIEDSYSETYQIQIPNDTTLVSSSTEATLTLNVKGLETKTCRVTNISYINNTDGYDATIYSDYIDVVLRGSKESIDALEDVNVRAVADLSGLGTGTGVVNVPVSIKVDGYSDIGAVGEYKVYIKISPSEQG